MFNHWCSFSMKFPLKLLKRGFLYHSIGYHPLCAGDMTDAEKPFLDLLCHLNRHWRNERNWFWSWWGNFYCRCDGKQKYKRRIGRPLSSFIAKITTAEIGGAFFVCQKSPSSTPQAKQCLSASHFSDIQQKRHLLFWQ